MTTVHRGDRAVATIGRARKPFSCLVCGAAEFTALQTELVERSLFRSPRDLGRSTVSLACTECGYLHAFLEGAVQLWPATDGYPAT